MFKKKCGYFLFLIFILAIFLYPVSILEVKNGKTGQIILRKRVSTGDHFQFQYIHSVSKSPVFGLFLITPGGTIKPVETTFLSYGPGLPSIEGKVILGKGTIVAKPEVEGMKEFSFFVSPFTHQFLIFRGERLDFSSMKEGEVIIVEVKKYPIGKALFKYGRQSN